MISFIHECRETEFKPYWTLWAGRWHCAGISTLIARDDEDEIEDDDYIDDEEDEDEELDDDIFDDDDEDDDDLLDDDDDGDNKLIDDDDD